MRSRFDALGDKLPDGGNVVGLQFLPLFLVEADGAFALDRTNGRVVMLLRRETEGPWLDVGGSGFYEMMVPV